MTDNPRRTRQEPYSGEWWVKCDQGHEHYGEHGAAGLLVFSVRSGRYLLQHRPTWVDHGDTWGTPGGALHEGEDAIAGAMREAKEEGLEISLAIEYGPPVVFTVDHGGWAFHTVLVMVDGLDYRETREAHGWALVSKDDLFAIGRPLHPGFEAFLHEYRRGLPG